MEKGKDEAQFLNHSAECIKGWNKEAGRRHYNEKNYYIDCRNIDGGYWS